jgi:hypothetical protein
MSSIAAGTTTGSALVSTGDTTGELVFKTNGTTTALTIDTSQNVTIAGNLTVTGNAPGSLKWQSAQTSNFTAVAGRAYPINTTSASITVTLPASAAAGDLLTFVDYAATWDTNRLVLNSNGLKLNGVESSAINVQQTERGAINLVYIDATQGWITYAGYTGTPSYALSFSVQFLVIAGGGAGGLNNNAQPGGGGAGGYISSVTGENSGGGTSAISPLTALTGTNYTVTVGGGGATGSTNGSISVFSTSTAIGGGRGNTVIGSWIASSSGGSGGGGGGTSGGAAGTAGQGYAGGNASGSGGGGGGAGSVGSTPGAGGVGVSSSITGSPVTRARGGAGGSGGGAGTANTGNGGGAGPSAGAGGSGVVILRYPNTFTIANPGGGLTLSTTTVGANKVTTITAGTGNVSWS